MELFDAKLGTGYVEEKHFVMSQQTVYRWVSVSQTNLGLETLEAVVVAGDDLGDHRWGCDQDGKRRPSPEGLKSLLVTGVSFKKQM